MNDFCHISVSSSKPLLNSWCHSFSSLTRLGWSIFQNKWCCVCLNTVYFLTWWRKAYKITPKYSYWHMINRLTSDPTYCILCENSTSGCLRVMRKAKKTPPLQENILVKILWAGHSQFCLLQIGYHFPSRNSRHQWTFNFLVFPFLDSQTLAMPGV